MEAPFVSEREVARRIGIASQSVTYWRRQAPEHHRCECGRTELYRDDEKLAEFIEERRRAREAS